MNLTDVFATPFKLTSSRTFIEPIPTLKVSLKTNNIHGKTTKEEIFILSKMYFDNYINQYKNYIIEDQPTTESTYKLTVGVLENNELKYKHIYSCFYNNTENRIAWENKYDENFAIEGNFFVSIDITAEVIPEYDSAEEEEDESPKPTRKVIREPECVICYENKPNVIYSDCLHMVICSTCDKNGRFKRCPFCRTRVNGLKITTT